MRHDNVYFSWDLVETLYVEASDVVQGFEVIEGVGVRLHKAPLKMIGFVNSADTCDAQLKTVTRNIYHSSGSQEIDVWSHPAAIVQISQEHGRLVIASNKNSQKWCL